MSRTLTELDFGFIWLLGAVAIILTLLVLLFAAPAWKSRGGRSERAEERRAGAGEGGRLASARSREP